MVAITMPIAGVSGFRDDPHMSITGCNAVIRYQTENVILQLSIKQDLVRGLTFKQMVDQMHEDLLKWGDTNWPPLNGHKYNRYAGVESVGKEQ